MRHITTSGLLALCGLVLSACFASDKPLIDNSTSATPLKPGTYIATETKPGEGDAPAKVKVSTEGNTTVFTSLEKGEENEAPSKVLLRKVRGNYYAMLEIKSDEKSYVYMLVQADGLGMSMYDFTAACKTLEGVAGAEHVDVASYGVARVEKSGDSDTCYFNSFDDLARAYKAVIDAAPLEAVTILKPAA